MDRSETAPLRTLLYTRLGMPPGASTEEIRRAYEVLEEVYRPGGASIDDAMHLAFTEISRAASILGNPRTRRLYDRGYIDEFGKRTSSGRARTAKMRAVVVASAFLAAGLTGLAVFTSGTGSQGDAALESAVDAKSSDRPAPQAVPPRPSDQKTQSVPDETRGPQKSGGAAPLQADARDYLPPEAAGHSESSVHASAGRPRASETPHPVVAAKRFAVHGSKLRLGEARTPARRRVARLSRTDPQGVQSYIWFGAPAPDF